MSNEEIARLRAEIAKRQKELEALEAESQRQALERIEEIRTEMAKLLQEAKTLSAVANITFYSHTFVQGLDRGRPDSPYSNDTKYWEQSEYC